MPVMAGIYLGGIIRRRVSEEIFRRGVLILLIVMGLNLIALFFV